MRKLNVQGGNVESVLCNDPKATNCNFYLLDYDTNGSEPEDVKSITQEDGDIEQAYVVKIPISLQPAIDLNEVTS